MNKNICYVFGAGDLYINSVEIPDNALTIAADGGLKHTKALGLKPDVILGDFDSYDINQVSEKCLVYPSEKDYTDMFIAIEHGYNAGIRRFEIYGGLGGKRIEHTISNLQLLEYFAKRNCEVFLHGDGETITSIFSNGTKRATLCFTSLNSGFISIFAAGGDIKGLNIKGLKYELDNATLKTEFPLGVSNEFCGRDAEISFDSGTAIIVWKN